MASESYRGHLEVVKGYREDIKAAMEFKGLEKDVQMIHSLKKDEEEMTSSRVGIHAANKEYSKVESLLVEAKANLGRLDKANQTFQELSVPLDYGDHKKMQFFKRAYGLELKATEEQAIAFLFHHLSKECPEKRGVVTMDIQDGKWKVLAVEPSVCDVAVCLDQLNNGGNLNTFCKRVRQKFKDHIKH